MEKTTTAIAIGGLTYPVWEVNLQHVGDLASNMVPILSALWLAVQIMVHVVKVFRGMRNG